MLFFTFSLYGENKIYTEGMIRNASILAKQFPSCRIQIYIADDVPVSARTKLSENPSVKLIEVQRKNDIRNMFDRFECIDDPDCTVMIVRDADSRVHARDISCIEDFLASDKLLHIIRDHRAHRTPILGGLWGIRKSGLDEPMINKIQKWTSGKTKFSKGTDQFFLRDIIYPLLKSKAMIHDRYSFYETPDMLSPFRVPIQDKLFCGQVHCFTNDGEEYTVWDP